MSKHSDNLGTKRRAKKTARNTAKRKRLKNKSEAGGSKNPKSNHHRGFFWKPVDRLMRMLGIG